jgi:hypothetical protein
LADAQASPFTPQTASAPQRRQERKEKQPVEVKTDPPENNHGRLFNPLIP